MLVHRRPLPCNLLGSLNNLHSFTLLGGECLVQEYNTLFPARARTRAPRSGVEGANYEATAPQTRKQNNKVKMYVQFVPCSFFLF